jgi:hypothetical protein
VMASPLERLLRLNRSSSKFHDKVSNILYGEEYKLWVQDISGGDAVKLVDFLDRVRCCDSFIASHSSYRRLLTLSTLPVPVSENACENSGTYVAKE